MLRRRSLERRPVNKIMKAGKEDEASDRFNLLSVEETTGSDYLYILVEERAFLPALCCVNSCPRCRPVSHIGEEQLELKGSRKCPPYATCRVFFSHCQLTNFCSRWDIRFSL
jgi:hypothetical protein